MPSFRLRPKLEIASPRPAAELTDDLRTLVLDEGSSIHGRHSEGRFELMTSREKHFWSPELVFQVRESGGGSLISGRFGPQPHVWVMFTIVYIHLAFLALASLMYGAAQWVSGGTLWPLWGVPLALVGSLAVFAGVRLGQRLGRPEMQELETFVRDRCAG